MTSEFEINHLVNDLAKPIYVWRMAWALSFKPGKQRNAAITRRDKAGKEIIAMVRAWVRDHPEASGE